MSLVFNTDKDQAHLRGLEKLHQSCIYQTILELSKYSGILGRWVQKMVIVVSGGHEFFFWRTYIQFRLITLEIKYF